jgi:hypothetical protein
MFEPEYWEDPCGDDHFAVARDNKVKRLLLAHENSTIKYHRQEDLIESQIRISKNRTKDRFDYAIKKSLWRNYATAKSALENPNSHHSWKSNANLSSDDCSTTWPTVMQTVEGIGKEFQAGGPPSEDRV